MFIGQPWELKEYGDNERESFAVLRQHVEETHPAYALFPHVFDMEIRYALSDNGLTQTVIIHNRGPDPLPLMLGFHTAFHVPFHHGSREEDYRIKVTIDQRWNVRERMMPDGTMAALDEKERMLRDEGVAPFSRKWSSYYTAEPQNGRNRMELTDSKQNIRLIYEVSSSYRNWTIWNGDAQSGFICAEPQTSAVNAANLQLPYEQTGMIRLEPGESWNGVSRILAEDGVANGQSLKRQGCD